MSDTAIIWIAKAVIVGCGWATLAWMWHTRPDPKDVGGYGGAFFLLVLLSGCAIQ